MLVLGLESTCDESSAALLQEPRKLLANVVKTQIETHARFGGVVPEVASRLHLHYLDAALREALNRANKSLEEVDVIAASSRPGLLGGLLVGVTLAKTLAWSYGKPLVLVDHLLGHLLSADLVEDMRYPCIAGIFSGGHCNIYCGQSALQWKLIIRTRDDAPGEAFDKVAKLMNLGYPGGPALQRFAEKGNPKAFKLPRPLPPSLEGDFSFSGIKTAVLYKVRGLNNQVPLAEKQWPDLAASFQEVVAQTLTNRLREAMLEHGVENLYLGGGVAANICLRQKLEARAKKDGFNCCISPLSLCMDNGAMIAHAGAKLFEGGVLSPLDEDVATRSRLGF